MIAPERVDTAARALCSELGLDPDMLVEHGPGSDLTTPELNEQYPVVDGVRIVDVVQMLRSPQWRLFRQEVHRHMVTHAVIQRLSQ